MKLSESTILQNYSVALRGQISLDATSEQVVQFYEVVVTAISDFLRTTKSKEKKIAVSIEDLKGTMILAAVVECNKNEDEDMQDNWNYYWTFDKEDIEDAVTYSASEASIQALIIKRAASMHHMKITNQGAIARMTSLVASTLSDYLEQNAKPGEKVTVEHEGFFIAESEVDGETIVKSFLPDGPMKVLIKDDAATEV